MEMKTLIILYLCPDIVVAPATNIVSELKYVLESKSIIRKIGSKWHARVGNVPFVFDEKPTEEYYNKLIRSPHDLSRHMAAVEDLHQRILRQSRGCSAFRQISVVYEDPPCKICKKTDYFDDGTHYTCKNCLHYRQKYERGLDMRNIKARAQEQGDANSCNFHVLDPLLSDNANRQTIVGIASGGESSFEEKRDMMRKSSKLSTVNKRMYKDITEIDQQIIRARGTIDDVIGKIRPHKAVATKAHNLFSKFVKSKGELPRENEIIAACLFDALSEMPEKPRVYPNPRKRKFVYNDWKQHRPKLMSFRRSKRTHSI